MTVLDLLWQISVSLASASTVIMLVLVLRRYMLNRLQARRQVKRKMLIREVVAYLETGDEAGIKRAVGRANASLLLAEVAAELFRLVRGNDADRLVSLLETSGSIDCLVSLCRHRQADKRLSAVETLTFLPGQVALGTLDERLGDPEPDIRLAAAIGLAQRGSVASVGALIDRLLIGEDEASPLFLTLFRALSPRYNAELIALLDADIAEPVRVLILDALGLSGDYGVLPALIGAAGHPGFEVRAAAMRGLSRLDHPRGRRAIVECLSDGDWRVRLQAAACCGQLGLTEAVEAIVGLLSDLQWWVRYRAAEALVRLGPAGRAALDAAAADSLEIRRLAITARRAVGASP